MFSSLSEPESESELEELELESASESLESLEESSPGAGRAAASVVSTLSPEVVLDLSEL